MFNRFYESTSHVWVLELCRISHSWQQRIFSNLPNLLNHKLFWRAQNVSMRMCLNTACKLAMQGNSKEYMYDSLLFREVNPARILLKTTWRSRQKSNSRSQISCNHLCSTLRHLRPIQRHTTSLPLIKVADRYRRKAQSDRATNVQHTTMGHLITCDISK